jgi:hypothetical protein
MEMLNFLLEGQSSQRKELEEMKRQQSNASAMFLQTDHKTAERLEQLEQQLGVLALYCRAAVEVMIEKGGMTRDELLVRMAQVDASDGNVDGQYRGPVDQV